MLGTMVDSFQELLYLVFMAIYEVDSDNIPILQIRILEHRKGKQFAPYHPPNNRRTI